MKDSRSSCKNEDDSRRFPNSYPSIFPITLTHNEFPSDAAVLEKVGLPIGCMVNLFMQKADRTEKTLEVARFVDDATKIARCDSCQAYINPYCEATQIKWYCSLCGNRNSIDRSMVRYRHTDVRSLPETRELVYDYPIPFRECDSGAEGYLPLHTIGQRGVMADERPLVHIFLIQESMPLDALIAVVESLSAAIEEMHPDIQIVLLTFSNKIGIYRMVNDGTYDDNCSAYEPNEVTTKVEYVHLATDSGKGDILANSEISPTSTSTSTCAPTVSNKSSLLSTFGFAGTPKGKNISKLPDKIDDDSINLMEGGEISDECPSESLPIIQAIEPKKEEIKDGTKAKRGGAMEDVCVVDALSSLSHFNDTAVPLGCCRQQALAALSSLLDNSCAYTDSADDDEIPQVVLGPVIDALSDWILQPSRRSEDEEEDESHQSISENERDRNGKSSRNNEGASKRSMRSSDDSQPKGLAGLLFGAIYSTGINLLSGNFSALGIGSDDDDENGTVKEGNDEPLLCPVDCCSGIILHVFLSSPQDLPANSHPSANRSGSGVDFNWSKDTGSLFGSRSLSVTLWSVVSFEGSGVGLKDLYPLAELTGGTVNRFVLGSYPKDERARLAETLTRNLTRQLATKCVLKLRTSSGVGVHDYCPTGHLSPDRDLPGVYRMASCSEDSTIGYQFMYKKDDATSPAKNGNAVILQLAFSYDTLVESSELIDESESDMEDCSDDNQSYDHNKNYNDSKNRNKNSDDNNNSSCNEESDGKLHGINIDGYFSSAVDIFGIKEEINAVKIEFEKQKAIELFKEGKFGKMIKRRIHSGSKFDLPSPSAVCSHPLARLSVPTHNAQPDNEMTLKKKGNIRAFSSYGQGSGYDRTVRLVAVRRLRIINIMIECTPKVSDVLKSSRPSVLSLLIARQALLEDNVPRNFKGSAIELEKIKEDDRQSLVLRWASSAVAATVEAEKKKNSDSGGDKKGDRKGVREGGGKGDKTGKGNKYRGVNEYNSVDISESENDNVNGGDRNRNGSENVLFNENADMHRACEHPLTLRLLKLLSGVTTHMISTPSTYTLNHSNINYDELIAIPDIYHQMRSILMTLSPRHCERIFYPELIPLKVHNTQTDNKSTVYLTTADRGSPVLDLNRQAMTSSGACSFLLDAGTDLIVYRTLASHNTSHGAHTNSHSHTSDATLPSSPHPTISSPSSSSPSSLHVSSPFPAPMSGTPQLTANISSTVSSNINMNMTNNTAITVNTSSNIISHQTSVHNNSMKSSDGNNNDNKDMNRDRVTDTPSITPTDPDKNMKEVPRNDNDVLLNSTALESPSLEIITLSQSHLWLPSELHRRLSLGLLPKLHCAQAGTSSSSVFTEKLLEDTYTVRTSQGFDGFLRSVVDGSTLNS